MPLQDEVVNENEKNKKGVIISYKAGADVHRPIVGFVYAGREFSCWNRWAIFTGMLNLFID